MKITSEPKKVLVSRECCIGDVLMSTPLLRALRKKYPDARIDYMVGDWSREVLSGNQNVSEIVPYINLRKSSIIETLRRIIELRRRRHDVVFTLDVGRGPNIIAKLAGIPERVGFDFRGNGIFLTDKVPREVNDMHELQAFLKLGDAVGAVVESKEMDFHLSEGDLSFARDFLERNGLSDGRQIIGIFPGGGINPGTTMPSKRWAESRFSSLALRLAEDLDSTLIMFGSEADRDVIERVREGISGSTAILVGASLGELAAVINRCRLFVTNDCGPMHLAAAVGTPTVSIWGPTDPNLLAPFGEEHRVVKPKVGCAPCYKQILGTFDSCERPDCMDSIVIEEVFEAVCDALGVTI